MDFKDTGVFLFLNAKNLIYSNENRTERSGNERKQ